MRCFLSFLILVILTGCADIDYRVQTTRFDTPETVGKTLGGQAALNYGSAHKITLARVFGGIIFDETVSTEATMSKSEAVGLHAELGIIDRLDLFYRSLDDGATFFGGKFQLIGAAENKRESGLKAAISFGYGTMDKDEGGVTISNADGSTEREYDTNLELLSYDVTFNIGYRVNKQTIVYLNNFYTYYDAKADLSSSSNGDVTITGISRSYGSLLGVRFGGQSFHVDIETGVSKAFWESRISQVIYPIGMQLGFSW